MRLPISCMTCLQENGIPNLNLSSIEFRDDGRYEFLCSNGHTSVTILQQQKFEVLFQIGAFAIKDGYYREAVSSFTSSLERFYEFAIKVFLDSAEIDDEEFKLTWKTVSNQSERQLGAFIFLHLREIGSKPELLSNPQVSFRNSVIHKGKIPSREEAINYGQSVLDCIKPLLVYLQENYSENVSNVTFKHLRDSRAPEDENMQVATISIPTIISLVISDDEHIQKTLEEAIAELKSW